jgi:hypothetical protein
METLDRKLYADVMEFDGRREPESVRPCPGYREGWPMDLYEMLSVNEVVYVSKMGLVIGLDVECCRRRSSAVYQPVVVALLLLKMNVKDVSPSQVSVGLACLLRAAYSLFYGARQVPNSNNTMAGESIWPPCVAFGF